MNTESLLEAIKNLDPGTSWGAIGAVFGRMEVSEDEIAKARARYPGHDGILWDGFKLLCPSVYIHGVPEPVYRAHCAELLDRVAQGLDTTLGTKAEVMMGLSSTSLKAPLTHTAAVLYAQLFREILVDAPILDDLELLSIMAFNHETERLLAELSKKCRDPGRKLARTKGERRG